MEQADFSAGYKRALERIGAERSVCAAVYTQLYDVESEANGLLAYDRQSSKVERSVLAQLNMDFLRSVNASQSTSVWAPPGVAKHRTP